MTSSLAIVTAAAHNRQELIRAQRVGVDAALVSPVFATRSHPHIKPLGPIGFGLMCRNHRIVVIALGGITTTTSRQLFARGQKAIAAIDGFSVVKT